MDAKLKRYYRKKMSGGRSIIARAADYIMLRSVILTVVFIVMLQWSHSIAVAIPVAALVTVAVSIAMYIYRKRKVEKFFEKDLKRIREKCLLETLTLMNGREYAEYIERLFPGTENVQPVPGGFLANCKGARMAVLHNHPKSECGVAEIVNALRQCKGEQKIVMISLSDYTEDAKKFSESASITLISGSDVLRAAERMGLLPDEESAEKRARQEMEEAAVTMDRLRRYAFRRNKVRAYILCGLIILIWPLFGIWRFYYPVISVLCFILAVISYKRGKHTQESAGINVS
jgi:hypothetical protein